MEENKEAGVAGWGKILGEKWKALSEEEKEPWQEKAKEDKERYDKEKAEYDLNNPQVDEDDSSDDDAPLKKQKKQKKKKDKNAPKKNMTAFLIFSNAERPKVMEENKEAGVAGWGKILGEKWKALSEEEKEPWQEKAKEDKERYDKEKAEYDLNNPQVDEDDSSDDDAPLKKQKKQKKKKDKNAPKKNMTAFLIFSNAERPKVMEENKEAGVAGWGKILGEKWKALSEEEKEPWQEKAKEDKARYEEEMEKYKAEKAARVAAGEESPDEEPSPKKRKTSSKPKVKKEGGAVPKSAAMPDDFEVSDVSDVE